jgi:hypothetical protein
MAATPLTIECRAIAVRMGQVGQLCGNAALMARMDGADAASLGQLKTAIEATAPGATVTALTTAMQRLGNVTECEGNTALHAVLASSSPAVVAACDFADAMP